MGNRARIVFVDGKASELSPMVLLHWNGGPESVYAFLAEMQRRGIGGYPDCAAARFCQIAGEFFSAEMDYKTGEDSYNLYVINGPETVAGLDCGDSSHGIYLVNGENVQRFGRQGDKTVKTSIEETARERETAIRHPQYAAIVQGFIDRAAILQKHAAAQARRKHG